MNRWISLVSRVSKTNAYEHVVLGTQSYKPREFATQVRAALRSGFSFCSPVLD